MPDETDSAGSKYDIRLTKSVEDLRSNAKWTLLAFGAIGTTLLAGSQLSNLGKFGLSDPRLLVAVGCAIFAMVAATFAVWSALRVANTGYVEFYHLEPGDIEYVERNSALLEGFGTVRNLREAYDNAIRARHAAITAERVDEQTFNSAEIWFNYLDGLVDIVVSYIRYNRIRQEAERSRAQLIGSSVIAALSLLGFAWAANPGAEQPPVLHSPASAAKLTLTAAGKTVLAPVIGEKCAALASIDVIVLNVTTSGSEVVTISNSDCPIARFTLTNAQGSLVSVGSARPTSTTGAVSPGAANDQPIVWTELLPDAADAASGLIARAIVAREAECPPLTVNGARWPMAMRADGSDPDFAIKLCEAALPNDATAQIGGVTFKQRPRAPSKIVVIGDTGCRITDYTAQPCDSADEWPFFRVAKAAQAMNPDLVIHLGDYHYREKPCAGRAGCTGSPYGDNWRTWDAEFFTPAKALLAAAPWLMLRGNHEDCARAGAGWNLLIRPVFGLNPGERCPVDNDPSVFTFEQLRLAVPDTASADSYGRERRVVTYREQIRTLAKKLGADSRETWLLSHQPLWVSYGLNRDGHYNADDVSDRLTAIADEGLREALCRATISPIGTFRRWFDDKIPAENPNEHLPSKDRAEKPCLETETPAGPPLAPPNISLVVSGDTHTFEMFLPDSDATKSRPLQLVVGNGGDLLESASFPGADKDVVSAAVNLFDVNGKLWLRHTFGFAVLEKSSASATWTATLYDVDGKAIARCDLKRPDGACR